MDERRLTLKAQRLVDLLTKIQRDIHKAQRGLKPDYVDYHIMEKQLDGMEKEISKVIKRLDDNSWGEQR